MRGLVTRSEAARRAAAGFIGVDIRLTQPTFLESVKKKATLEGLDPITGEPA
jgi:hypothetical protein